MQSLKLETNPKLNKIHQYYPKYDIACISTYDLNQSRKENRRSNEILKARLLDLGYSLLAATALFYENAEPKKQFKKVFFIVINESSKSSFKDDIIKLGEEYNQEFVLFSNKEGSQSTVIGCSHQSKLNLKFLEERIFSDPLLNHEGELNKNIEKDFLCSLDIFADEVIQFNALKQEEQEEIKKIAFTAKKKEHYLGYKASKFYPLWKNNEEYDCAFLSIFNLNDELNIKREKFITAKLLSLGYKLIEMKAENPLNKNEYISGYFIVDDKIKNHLKEDLTDFQKDFKQFSFIYFPAEAILENSDKKALFIQVDADLKSIHESGYNKEKLSVDSPIFYKSFDEQELVFENIGRDVCKPGTLMGMWGMSLVAKKTWEEYQKS